MHPKKVAATYLKEILTDGRTFIPGKLIVRGVAVHF